MTIKKANREKNLINKANGYELQIGLGIDEVTWIFKSKSFIGNSIEEVKSKEKAYYASTINNQVL